jgi:hypothetical protein
MKLENVTTFMLLLASFLLGPFPSAQAKDEQMSDLSDSEIKAAHIFKFKKYAEWPQDVLSSGAPIVIGVAGGSEIGQALERLVAKRDPGKREVKIRQLQQGEELEGIHILFIGNDQVMELTDWLNRAQGKPILCVTDTGSAMPPGSMINFVQDNNRIRFDVSLTAAERSQVKLSAALLTVAREVYGAKP